MFTSSLHVLRFQRLKKQSLQQQNADMNHTSSGPSCSAATDNGDSISEPAESEEMVVL